MNRLFYHQKRHDSSTADAPVASTTLSQAAQAQPKAKAKSRARANRKPPAPTTRPRRPPTKPLIRLLNTRPRLPPPTALILGGSRGIGLAIASRFAALGYRVQIVGRNRAALAAAVGGLNGDRGGARGLHSFRVGSVTDPAFWDAVAGSMVENEFGAGRALVAARNGRGEEEVVVDGGKKKKRGFDHRDDEDVDLAAAAVADRGGAPFTFVPDVLVNCAGVAQAALLGSTAPTAVSEILDTNLTAAIVACRVLSKHMVQAKMRAKRGETRAEAYDPCIVNVASVLATHGGRGSSVYAASKAGVVGLTRALAGELGPLGVRVNCVNPGFIGTKMLEGKCRLRRIHLRRPAFSTRRCVSSAHGPKAKSLQT